MDRDYWQRIPNEIIQIVLYYVDGQSLLNCRLINKVWKRNVDGLLKLDCMWKKMCNTMLIEDGKNTHLKSTLCWRDVFINELLWYKFDGDIKIETNEYLTKSNMDIVKIKVYKDILIIITNGTVSYYNIHNLSLIREWVIKCDDLIQNEYMIAVIVSENQDQHVCGKERGSEDLLNMSSNLITIKDCAYICVEDQNCYAITNKGHIYKHSWRVQTESWSSQFLARYYSMSIVAGLHVTLGEVYVRLSRSNYMKVDEARGIVVHTDSIPDIKHRLVASCPEVEDVGSVDLGATVLWAARLNNWRCDVFLSRKECNTVKNKHFIRMSLNNPGETAPSIVALNVHHPSCGALSVLLATRRTVYKVTVSLEHKSLPDLVFCYDRKQTFDDG